MTSPQQTPSTWLDVLKEGQRQTAEAHLAFQRALTDAHAAYLAAFESTQHALVAAIAGQAVPMPVTPALASGRSVEEASEETLPPIAVTSRTPVSKPVTNGHSVKHPNGSAVSAADNRSAMVRLADVDGDSGMNGHAHGHDARRGAPHHNGKASPLQMPVSQRVQQRTSPTPLGNASLSTVGGSERPVLAAPTRTPSSDTRALLIDVVAEKTGYPKDSLDDSMSLEADLGIDSIKRVEILSALKERVPNLPTVDAVKLAQLATLGDIAGALDGSPGASRPF